VSVAETQVPAAGHVTVSVGLAEFNAATADARALFLAADAALYEAKRNGRDRVCCFDAATAANPTPFVGVK
jgi:PleD family two-component response regulator